MTGTQGRGASGEGREQLSCEQFAERLADFLEREVDESTRASLEAHALGCADCGPLLADLRTLRIDAANLPELAPSRDLWAGIAGRIETPVIELPAAGGGGRWAMGDGRTGSRHRRRVWMTLAAAGLVAITAGITHVMTKQVYTRSPNPNAVAQRPITVAPVASSPATPDIQTARPDSAKPTPVAASTMVAVSSSNPDGPRPSPIAHRPSPIESEISRLKAIVKLRRSQLDPVTLGVVDRNLSVIDDAIAQVKQALRKDPESRFLMESLNDALENKIEVLRTAALLPSRT